MLASKSTEEARIDSIADTSAIICLSRRDPKTIRILSGKNFAVTFVTVAELLVGIQKAQDQQAASRKVTPITSGRQTFYPSEKTVLLYVKLCGDLERRGKPIPTNDLWIAAMAMEKGLPLIARDEHFSRIEGLSIIVC